MQPFASCCRIAAGKCFVGCDVLQGGGIHFAFFYLALDNSQFISSVAVVLQLGVPFATILSVIFLGEVIKWRRILGIALAFGGVIILIFEPTIFSDLGGVYYALLAALSIAISLLFMKKLKDVKVFDLQAWIAFISFLFLATISFLVEENQLDLILNASIIGWGAILFTAFAATAIGHAGFYYLITKYVSCHERCKKNHHPHIAEYERKR